MSDVTHVLSRIEAGDSRAAEQLLPLVYEELRKLAAAKLAQEQPGQTLQATALVHEAYLRLVVPHKATTSGRDSVPHKAATSGRDSVPHKAATSGRGSLNSELKPEGPAPQLSFLTPSPQPLAPPAWHSRGHFFAAAAEAMRRILVENARQKASLKRGGPLQRLPLSEIAADDSSDPHDLLALDEALDRLTQADPQAAEVVKLRYFAGLTMDETALALGISPRTAYYAWEYARSWLRQNLRSVDSSC